MGTTCPSDKLYQEEIKRLENVIAIYRSMAIVSGMSANLLDSIEEEAYNSEN